jgi:hypothetical protein
MATSRFATSDSPGPTPMSPRAIAARTNSRNARRDPRTGPLGAQRRTSRAVARRNRRPHALRLPARRTSPLRRWATIAGATLATKLLARLTVSLYTTLHSGSSPWLLNAYAAETGMLISRMVGAAALGFLWPSSCRAGAWRREPSLRSPLLRRRRSSLGNQAERRRRSKPCPKQGSFSCPTSSQ